MSIENKSVLITGGTGTLGHALLKRFLSLNPKKVIIYSRDEFKQDNMLKQYLNEERIRFFIGDVRDEERLNMATKGVDIIIHAAALKQVPAIEYNPIEAVKTNIQGTKNVIGAALLNNVKKVVFVSTDKAVYPVNLYGATKMVAEKLIIQANHYSGWKEPRFSVVRYGNVTGSRGSILPIFQSISDGVYPITDIMMSRFWMTTKDAVNLILDTIEEMQGGEIFIPKMKSYFITDLAKAINSNAQIKITGIRSGEKLHESMLNEDDCRRLYEGKHYIIKHSDNGKHLKIEMSNYTSGMDLMSIEEIKEAINELSRGV